MSERTTYYAVTLMGKTGDDPVGLARRRESESGAAEDEMLRQNMSWQPDSLIREWKRGDAVEELHEINKEEAEALIEQFRRKWAG